MEERQVGRVKVVRAPPDRLRVERDDEGFEPARLRAVEDAERDFVEALTFLKRRVAYSKSASGTAAVRLVACSNSALASL